MTTKTPLQEYGELLDEAIIAYMDGDAIPYTMLCDQYGVEYPVLPPSQTCSVMKAATARTPLPMEYRQRAKKWLLDNGFESLDDGDVEVE